jgi:hypothetical protein
LDKAPTLAGVELKVHQDLIRAMQAVMPRVNAVLLAAMSLFVLTLPVCADFNGDGKSDMACGGPPLSPGTFSRAAEPLDTRSSGAAPGDIPIVGDFDGDSAFRFFLTHRMNFSVTCCTPSTLRQTGHPPPPTDGNRATSWTW